MELFPFPVVTGQKVYCDIMTLNILTSRYWYTGDKLPQFSFRSLLKYWIILGTSQSLANKLSKAVLNVNGVLWCKDFEIVDNKTNSLT